MTIISISIIFTTFINLFALSYISCQQEFSSNVTYSLLIAARNDKYCGNSPERLQYICGMYNRKLNTKCFFF